MDCSGFVVLVLFCLQVCNDCSTICLLDCSDIKQSSINTALAISSQFIYVKKFFLIFHILY